MTVVDKPDTVVVWGKNATKILPSAQKQDAGYDHKSVIAFEEHNAILNNATEHIAHHDAHTLSPAYENLEDFLSGRSEGEYGLINGLGKDEQPFSVAWAKTTSDTTTAVLKTATDGRTVWAATATQLFAYNAEDGTTKSGYPLAVSGCVGLVATGQYIYHAAGGTTVLRYSATSVASPVVIVLADNVVALASDGQYLYAALANGHLVAYDQDATPSIVWTNNTDLAGKTITDLATNGVYVAATIDTDSLQVRTFSRNTGLQQESKGIGGAADSGLCCAYGRDHLFVGTNEIGSPDRVVHQGPLKGDAFAWTNLDLVQNHDCAAIAVNNQYLAYAAHQGTTVGLVVLCRLPQGGDRHTPIALFDEVGASSDPINDVALDPWRLVVASDDLTSDSNRTLRVFRLPTPRRAFRRTQHVSRFRAPFYGWVEEIDS